MKFCLEIKATPENGFSEIRGEIASDVAWILREAADKLEGGVMDFTLYSATGNPIGSAELSNDAKPALKPRR